MGNVPPPVSTKRGWRHLTADERWERFEDLHLSEDAVFMNRVDFIEFHLPATLLIQTLEGLLSAGYVWYKIDVSHDSGRAWIGAQMPRDLAPDDEIARDWV
jgi:hypothetical protein